MSESAGERRLPVALAPLSVGRPDHPSGLIEAALAGQFPGFGLTLRTPDGNWQQWCRDPRAVDAVRALLAEHRLTVLDVGIVTLDPDMDLDAVRELAGIAAALGGSRLVLMCRDPDFGRSVARLRQIAGIAAASGLRAGLEFMPYTAARDLDYAARLVTTAGHPSAGILFDMFQHVRSGGTPSAITAAHAEKFVLVQLSDGLLASPPRGLLRREALTDRRYPGEGEFPLGDMMARLPAGVPVTVEAPCQRYASLPLAEQGAALGRATRQFLRTIRLPPS